MVLANVIPSKIIQCPLEGSAIKFAVAQKYHLLGRFGDQGWQFFNQFNMCIFGQMAFFAFKNSEGNGQCAALIDWAS